MTATLLSSIYLIIGIATAIVTVIWLILVVTSLLFRPKADGRVLERILMVTSGLMMLCLSAVFLLLRARGAS